jgi:catechol 2,3-dioxygenase-like lactoylglutathione lyase family enzyme
MLPFTALSHVSVTVTDLARAREFYESVLGLRELPRPAFPFPGAWYDLGGDLALHVSVKDEPPPRAASGPFDPRDPHFALAVADADDVYERLRGAGRPFHDFVQTPTGLRQLFVRDPDGNMIEFIGPTRERRVRTMESDSAGGAPGAPGGR